jgi:hypothetical protein
LTQSLAHGLIAGEAKLKSRFFRCFQFAAGIKQGLPRQFAVNGPVALWFRHDRAPT